nr:DNA methyltransferase [Candidatus Sigynarchaeota archaeon]
MLLNPWGDDDYDPRLLLGTRSHLVSKQEQARGSRAMAKHENSIILGDCRSVLKALDDKSIDVCITSPPYWGCRDYGTDGQIGIEQNPFDYVAELAGIFAVIKKKLKPEGNVFIIIDDVWVSNWTRCRQHTWISSKDGDEGISNEDIQDKCKIPRNWPKTLGMD